MWLVATILDSADLESQIKSLEATDTGHAQWPRKSCILYAQSGCRYAGTRALIHSITNF